MVESSCVWHHNFKLFTKHILFYPYLDSPYLLNMNFYILPNDRQTSCILSHSYFFLLRMSTFKLVPYKPLNSISPLKYLCLITPYCWACERRKDCLCVVLYIVVTTSRHKNRQEIHFRLSASRTVGNIISYLILFLHGGSPSIPRMLKCTKKATFFLGMIGICGLCVQCERQKR